MSKISPIIMAVAALSMMLSGSIPAQSETPEVKENAGGSPLSINADLVSRYVSRGVEGSRYVSLQPAIALNFGGFSLGGWGSYSLAFKSGQFDEIDFWLAYSINGPAGTIALGAMDYFFPISGDRFDNFKNNNSGAHTVELNALYEGIESFPITALWAINVYNDTSYSIYGELGYSFPIMNMSLDFVIGGATGPSEWNGVVGGHPQITNLSLGVTREVAVPGMTALSLNLSFLHNPHTESSYLIFKTGF